MFKKALIVFGALVGATILATSPSIAASHHRHGYSHHAVLAGKSRTVGRPRHVLHVATRFRGRSRGRFSRVAARHHLHYARAHRLIRHARYATNYAPTRATPAGGFVQSGFVQTGGASFYSGGRRTAAGGFVGAATCAHRSLPFGTQVRVTNLSNQRTAVLTVNDRGPFVRGRVIDVSRGAAGTLGMLHSGVAQVRLEVVGRAG